jgi:hypothetical protein
MLLINSDFAFYQVGVHFRCGPSSVWVGRADPWVGLGRASPGPYVRLSKQKECRTSVGRRNGRKDEGVNQGNLPVPEPGFRAEEPGGQESQHP